MGLDNKPEVRSREPEAKTFGFMNTKICLLVFATLVFASSAIGQLDKKSEKAFKEKYFMAENFLLAENYTKALNIYFELKSMDPENANIKWKIGTCFLNSSGKKTSAIPFLESAASNISPDYAYDSPLEKYAPVQALRPRTGISSELPA